MCTGEDLGAFFVDSSNVRDALITYPSSSYLMPSPLFWSKEEALVTTKDRNYTVNDFQQFFMYLSWYQVRSRDFFFQFWVIFRDLDAPNSWEYYQDNIHFQKNLTAPNVKVYCMHGRDVETIEKYASKMRS